MKKIKWDYNWEEIEEELPVSFNELKVGNEVKVIRKFNEYIGTILTKGPDGFALKKNQGTVLIFNYKNCDIYRI